MRRVSPIVLYWIDALSLVKLHKVDNFAALADGHDSCHSPLSGG